MLSNITFLRRLISESISSIDTGICLLKLCCYHNDNNFFENKQAQLF